MSAWLSSLPHFGFENEEALNRWEHSESGFLNSMTEAIAGARRANNFLDWVMKRPEKRIAVEEKFRKYFWYLARCEGKICTTTLKFFVDQNFDFVLGSDPFAYDARVLRTRPLLPSARGIVFQKHLAIRGAPRHGQI